MTHLYNRSSMRVTSLLIIGLLFLASCKKQCPPFDRSLLGWIPYQVDDTVGFTSNANDSIFFIITDKEIIDDESTYGSCDKCGCSSNSSMYYEEIINGDYFISERIINEKNNSIALVISVYMNEKAGEFSLITDDFHSHVVDELIINNKTYNNLIIIESDTIKHPNYSEYWKIILAENKGIVKIFGRATIPDFAIIE